MLSIWLVRNTLGWKIQCLAWVIMICELIKGQTGMEVGPVSIKEVRQDEGCVLEIVLEDGVVMS